MSSKATFKSHDAWLNRLVKQTNDIMYSADGAYFQGWALSQLDYVHSEAHKSIGRLVRAINNGNMEVSVAKMVYVGLLTESD